MKLNGFVKRKKSGRKRIFFYSVCVQTIRNNFLLRQAGRISTYSFYCIDSVFRVGHNPLLGFERAFW